MKRTAIYMRVSTQQQAQEGDSLSAQREALLSYIDSHSDMILAGEYMDDGISGQQYEARDELQRMLSDVRSGRIDLIICTKMDRLHRSLKHFLDMQEILDEHGVKWLAIWEPMYDTSTPAGQLIINQMMSFAQFEAQNTGARIRQVIGYKVSQGQAISGKVPCGYTIKDKRLVPNDIAPSVIEAFNVFSMTGGIAETMRRCESLPGLPRLETSFRKMLTNRKYIGEYRDNLSYCPPLVSRELFEDVGRKLAMNIKRSQKRCYLFSGLCRCAECGYRLDVNPRTLHLKSGDKPIAYYRCSHHYRLPGDCTNKMTYNEERLEDYMLANIKREISGYVFQCHQKDIPRRDNTRRIAELQKKVDRLKDLYLNELISIEEYKHDRARYLEEIQALATEVPEEPVDTSALEKLLSQDIESYYKGLTVEERRFFWRSIIKRIRIDSKKNVEIEFL